MSADWEVAAPTTLNVSRAISPLPLTDVIPGSPYEYVFRSDYDALKAEVERLKGELNYYTTEEWKTVRTETRLRAEAAEARVKTLKAELRRWVESTNEKNAIICSGMRAVGLPDGGGPARFDPDKIIREALEGDGCSTC